MDENLVNLIASDLKQQFGKSMLTKQELCSLLGIKVPTLNERIVKKKDLPNYMKVNPEVKNSKVLFHIRDIADFLSQHRIKTIY